MKCTFKALSLGIVLSTLSTFSQAHSSHSRMEPLAQEAIVDRADQMVETLLSKDHLEDSWAHIKVAESIKMTASQGKVWSVRYTNPNASDNAKQDLYIFVDEMGNPLGANHNGEL